MRYVVGIGGLKRAGKDTFARVLREVAVERGFAFVMVSNDATLFARAAGDPDVAFKVRDMTALLEMVRQGLGVTIVPALSLPKERSGLRVLELKPRQRRKLFMATNRQSLPSPAVQAFTETLRSSRR